MVKSARFFLIFVFVAHAAASEPLADDAVATRFAILAGFPSAEPGAAGAALLVPGSVIPLDAETAGARDPGSIQQTLSFSKTVDKLWAAFRLDPARQIEKGKVAIATRGKPVELPSIPEAGVAITATLLSHDATNAVFRVVMTQGDKPIADSTVKATRGGRAVVGGLGGEKAPYIFLVIEPEDLNQSPKSTERMRHSTGVTVPQALSKVPPQYPAEAKERKVSGTVVLELQVGADGAVQDLRVLEYPDPSLSSAAMEAVRQWKFQPARLDDGTAVPVTCRITVNFQLR